MKKNLLLLLLLCIKLSYAQIKIYEYFKVDKLPKFSYQQKDINNYLKNIIIFKTESFCYSYKFLISFVVNENGKVSDVQILHSCSQLCSEILKKAFLNLPPWEAGEIGLTKVKTRMYLTFIDYVK